MLIKRSFLHVVMEQSVFFHLSGQWSFSSTFNPCTSHPLKLGIITHFESGSLHRINKSINMSFFSQSYFNYNLRKKCTLIVFFFHENHLLSLLIMDKWFFVKRWLVVSLFSLITMLYYFLSALNHTLCHRVAVKKNCQQSKTIYKQFKRQNTSPFVF